MIEFVSYGSSSAGNLYTVTDGNTKIIVEAGFTGKAIRKKIGKLSDYNACFISHEHGDHSKGISDILSSAVPVYATQETITACDVFQHHRP